MKISIIGSGWLGQPLLQALVHDGHEVIGTSRSVETLDRIEEAGGIGVLLSLPGALPDKLLNNPEVVIITLPPGGRQLGKDAPGIYLQRLEALAPLLAVGNPPLVLYTSSTGVYGAAAGVVDETAAVQPNTHSGKAVIAAEKWLLREAANLAILRLAGLVGPGRHPGRFYGGRSRPIPQCDAPVNLVHRDDVIAAIKLLLSKPAGLASGPQIFNVCAAAHPTKGEFYAAASTALGLEIAGKETGGHNGKIISSDKLRALGWQPQYDDLNF